MALAVLKLGAGELLASAVSCCVILGDKYMTNDLGLARKNMDRL